MRQGDRASHLDPAWGWPPSMAQTVVAPAVTAGLAGAMACFCALRRPTVLPDVLPTYAGSCSPCLACRSSAAALSVEDGEEEPEEEEEEREPAPAEKKKDKKKDKKKKVAEADSLFALLGGNEGEPVGRAWLPEGVNVSPLAGLCRQRARGAQHWWPGEGVGAIIGASSMNVGMAAGQGCAAAGGVLSECRVPQTVDGVTAGQCKAALPGFSRQGLKAATGCFLRVAYKLTS